MKKSLAFLTLILLIFTLSGCKDNFMPDPTYEDNWQAKITNNENIYIDELSDDKLKLDLFYYGFKQEYLRFELNQKSSYVSFDSGYLYFSNSIYDGYEFNLYVFDDRLKSPLIATKRFVVKLTRGIISGEKVVSQVVLTIKGDSMTSRGISWFSSRDITDSDVLVSKSESFEHYNLYEGKRQTFSRYAYKTDQEKKKRQTNFYNHQADIVDLEPDTKYYYKVGSLSKDVFSEVGNFKTSGRAETKIVLTSDIHVGTPEGVESYNRFYHTALKDAFARSNQDVDLIISTGDNISQWHKGNYYFEYEWSRLMNISSYLNKSTFVTMSGNHDTGSKNKEFDYAFPNHFNLPNAPKEINDGHIQGPNYSFDYNETHFIVFNYHQKGSVTADQTRWLENDLKNNEHEKIIFLSHIEVPKEIKDILEDNNVGIAYSGHEHYYRRTGLVKNNVKQKSVYKNNLIKKNEGTMYVTNSSTGGNSGWRVYNNSQIDEFGFGFNSYLGSLGELDTLKAGMYSILTISFDKIEVDVYLRNSENALDPYVLFDSYGLFY